MQHTPKNDGCNDKAWEHMQKITNERIVWFIQLGL